MKRSLVKQGESTMMISLPAKWIKENNLEKGSEIDMFQIDNNLLISSKPLNKKTETEIRIITTLESSIRMQITNVYRNGYDKIKAKFETQKQFEILKETVKTRLMGFDIIKKEKDYCIIENIAEPSKEQFESILKKVLYNIKELFSITKKRMEDPKETYDYEEVEELIQKYDNFCRRVISKKEVTEIKSELIWAYLTLLIHAQRELYYLNKILNDKIKITDKTKQLLKQTEETFNIISLSYTNKNLEILEKAREMEKTIVPTTGYKLLIDTEGKETIIVYHILQCMRSLYHSTSPLSTILM